MRTPTENQARTLEAPGGICDHASHPMHPLALQTGLRLTYEIADFDAADRYTFEIQRVGPPLRCAWSGAGTPEPGRIVVGENALADGVGLLAFSQGVAYEHTERELYGDDNRTDLDTPPFLLPRASFRRLTAGSPTRLAYLGHSFELHFLRLEMRPLWLGGPLVQTVHAEGDEIDLWVVNDRLMPLVVLLEMDDENYVRLEQVQPGALV